MKRMVLERQSLLSGAGSIQSTRVDLLKRRIAGLDQRRPFSAVDQSAPAKHMTASSRSPSLVCFLFSLAIVEEGSYPLSFLPPDLPCFLLMPVYESSPLESCIFA